jgi:uncharacterized RDD family membrane protein YckC
MLIDGLIVGFGIAVPMVLIFFAINRTGPLTNLRSFFWLLMATYAFAMLAPILYDIVMIARTGATFGKSFRKLSVVRTDGEPVSVGRCVLRTIVKLFVSGFLGIGYLMALFTAKKQALHDLVADTIVVRSGN